MINDPIFPYKNLFITARPGMGATTLIANIVNNYLQYGKKCLIFESVESSRFSFIERIRAIKEDLPMEEVCPWVVEQGSLVVMYNVFFECDTLLKLADEYEADVVVYEAPKALRNQGRDVVRLVEELKHRGKTFIFATHLKRRRNLLSGTEIHRPALSKHKKAIFCFDATVILYSGTYYGKKGGEEIRIYEKGHKRFRTVPIEIDSSRQRIIKK